jgi:hypothetical protein
VNDPRPTMPCALPRSWTSSVASSSRSSEASSPARPTATRRSPYIACTDIGAFAALAFADPDRFVDRKLNLLGDFTSGDDLAATLTRVGGRPVRHKVPPVWLKRIFAREWITLRRMFEGCGRPPHPPAMLDALAECRSLRPETPRLRALRAYDRVGTRDLTRRGRRDSARVALLPANEDPRRHSLSSVGLHRAGDVGVDLAGDVGAAVGEAVAGDVDVDAGLERQRRPGVAQAVELQPWEGLGRVGTAGRCRPREPSPSRWAGTRGSHRSSPIRRVAVVGLRVEPAWPIACSAIAASSTGVTGEYASPVALLPRGGGLRRSRRT